jgi:AcrR family transcriptional regulator
MFVAKVAMARPQGARDKDYDARRLTLASALRVRLADRSGPPPSYAELAKAAGVSLATLRHYFGSRDEAVASVLRLHGALGEPHLTLLATPLPDFAVSIGAAVDQIAEGLAEPLVAQLHAVGLAEGLAHATIGPTYLTDILEPTMVALEARLAGHMQAGHMRAADLRAAAIMLISPLVLARLHQGWLGGSVTRPLSEPEHRAALAEAFVRAYAS